MKNTEFIQKAKNIATNYKTLYVMGCFGSPMTASNKVRYSNNHSYNKKPERTQMIQAATASTFGFDCVGLIKGILWDWTGNKSRVYGGAAYQSNKVPDKNANQMIDLCADVSTNFENIVPGEVVWMKDHIGIYIGNGLAVESTPRWKNGVQITAVHNIGKKSGYNGRSWTKHGKLPYVVYVTTEVQKEDNPEPEAKKDNTNKALKTFVKEVQKACGATVDGIAGSETLSKTVTISAEINSRHAVVKTVQKRLAALGYKEIGTADGVAGPKFTAAVKHFQKDNGCVADGEITAKNKTWKKLLGMV